MDKHYSKSFRRLLSKSMSIPIRMNRHIFLLVILLSLTEAYLYDGFVSNFIGIDIKILIVMTIFLNWLHKTKSEDDIFISRFNRIVVLPLASTIYLLLILVEIRNGTGYVFSHVHIHPEITFLTLTFSAGMYLSSIIPKPKKLSPVPIITAVIIVYSFISTVYFSLAYFPSLIHRLVGEDTATYRQRMKTVWGDYYDHVVLYQDVVPEDSSVAHPPQENPWQMEGNQLLLRYFLYPRQLYSATNEDFYSSLNSADWIMITAGNTILYPSSESFYGWPILPVPIAEVQTLLPRTLDASINNIIIERLDGSESILSLLEEVSLGEDGGDNELDDIYQEVVIEDLATANLVKVELNSNLSYSVSVVAYVDDHEKGDFEYEGNPNTIKNQLTTIQLNISDVQAGLSDAQSILGIYLKYTNRAPLPYLYGEAIAKVGKLDHNDDLMTSEQLSNLGAYHYTMGDFDQARELYEQALLLKSSNLESLVGLYYLNMQENNQKEARRYASILSSLLTHESPNLGEDLLREMRIK